MTAQGSGGNVGAAIASVIIPGLGQLAQGRPIAAVLFFVVGFFLWLITFCLFGWVVNIVAALDAAKYQAPVVRRRVRRRRGGRT